MQQIYCEEGTLCYRYPLQQKKLVKRIWIQGFISALFGALFIPIFISPLVAMFLASRQPEGQALPASSSGGVPVPLSLLSSVYLKTMIVLFFLIFISKAIRELLYFRFYFYDTTDKEIVIRKGIIARRELTVSFANIQDIYIDQDFWDRILGLYDVHFATAGNAPLTLNYGTYSMRGGSYGEAHIDGVNESSAQALKSLIIEKKRLMLGQINSTGL